MQEAAAELDKAAAEAQGKAPVPKPDPTPPVTSALSNQIATHGAALIELAGQLAIAATMALFLLAAGDTFRRKLLHIVGGPLSQRRVTVEILNEIDVQVQRYLLVMLVTNILLALLCWGAFSFIGLARPALWATVTGVLHFIPYVGGVLAAAVVAVAALIETGSIGNGRVRVARDARPRRRDGDGLQHLAAGARVPHEPGVGVRRGAAVRLALGGLGFAARCTDRGRRSRRSRTGSKALKPFGELLGEVSVRIRGCAGSGVRRGRGV